MMCSTYPSKVFLECFCPDKRSMWTETSSVKALESHGIIRAKLCKRFKRIGEEHDFAVYVRVGKARHAVIETSHLNSKSYQE